MQLGTIVILGKAFPQSHVCRISSHLCNLWWKEESFHRRFPERPDDGGRVLCRPAVTGWIPDTLCRRVDNVTHQVKQMIRPNCLVVAFNDLYTVNNPNESMFQRVLFVWNSGPCIGSGQDLTVCGSQYNTRWLYRQFILNARSRSFWSEMWTFCGDVSFCWHRIPGYTKLHTASSNIGGRSRGTRVLIYSMSTERKRRCIVCLRLSASY